MNERPKYIRVGFDTGVKKGLDSKDEIGRIIYKDDGTIASVIVMNIDNILTDLNINESNAKYWYNQAKAMQAEIDEAKEKSKPQV